MQRGPAAAALGVVEGRQAVVHQGGAVDELEGRGECVGRSGRTSPQARATSTTSSGWTRPPPGNTA
jgi:hypothetical protein